MIAPDRPELATVDGGGPIRAVLKVREKHEKGSFVGFDLPFELIF
jgi:hypothetical protein